MTRGYVQENFSQRQLRSSEVIRKALSDIFLHGKVMHRELLDKSITISQVNVSIDLKYAKVYVYSFGDDSCDDLVKALNDIKISIRKLVTKKINFKYSPDLHFYVDDSFDYANRIDQLVKTCDSYGE